MQSPPPTLVKTGHITSVTDGPSTFLMENVWALAALGIVLGLAWFAFRMLRKRLASLR